MTESRDASKSKKRRGENSDPENPKVLSLRLNSRESDSEVSGGYTHGHSLEFKSLMERCHEGISQEKEEP